MTEHRYGTIAEKVRAVFTVSSSRFIAAMAPAVTEKEAQRFIDA